MKQRQEIFTLLGGRVNMMRGTYNPTSDAAWLAAAVGDVPAKTVLDVGIGTGGVALCLHNHNKDAHITGLDTSSAMLAQCAENAELNNVNIELVNADITTWRTDQTFDLVVSNPPYFNGTPAAHNAHHNADLATWIKKCVARTRPRGTFCTIVDAKCTATVIAAMHPTCGAIEIFPLFGAANTAERVIIRGRVGVKTGTTIHMGRSMNTECVLRHGLTIGKAFTTLSQT